MESVEIAVVAASALVPEAVGARPAVPPSDAYTPVKNQPSWAKAPGTGVTKVGKPLKSDFLLTLFFCSETM